MIPEERIERIKILLKTQRTISIEELCKQTYCSTSTIRRDLIFLENAGILRRTHGGATLIADTTTEFSSSIRSLEHKEQKKKICKMTARYIKDDMSIFIDASSTLTYLCNYLKCIKNLTVITNGLNVAMDLNHNDNIQVFLTGGLLKNHSGSLIGEYTSTFINSFNADLSLMSCKCLDVNGVYEADYRQSLTKQHMLRNSQQALLLADSSKFMGSSHVKLANTTDFSVIITDSNPFIETETPEVFVRRLVWE